MRTKRYTQPRDGRRRNGQVRTARPAPEVWAAALQLARGDVRRLEVESDGSVIVHNPPQPR